MAKPGRKKGSIPWNKGLKTGPLTDQHKKNISRGLQGHEVSAKTRKKIAKGHEGLKHTEDTKNKIRAARAKQQNAPENSPEICEKIGASNKKKWDDPDFQAKMMAIFQSEKWKAMRSTKQKALWQDPDYQELLQLAHTGLEQSAETIAKRSEKLRRLWKKPEFREMMEEVGFTRRGADHHHWRNDATKIPYPPEFNDELKERIRERDNFTCQGYECGITENEHHHKYASNLHVHHIDYDKQNSDENNLITLCNSCNSKAEYGDPQFWIEKYSMIVRNKSKTNMLVEQSV